MVGKVLSHGKFTCQDTPDSSTSKEKLHLDGITSPGFPNALVLTQIAVKCQIFQFFHTMCTVKWIYRAYSFHITCACPCNTQRYTTSIFWCKLPSFMMLFTRFSVVSQTCSCCIDPLCASSVCVSILDSEEDWGLFSPTSLWFVGIPITSNSISNESGICDFVYRSVTV